MIISNDILQQFLCIVSPLKKKQQHMFKKSNLFLSLTFPAPGPPKTKIIFGKLVLVVILLKLIFRVLNAGKKVLINLKI